MSWFGRWLRVPPAEMERARRSVLVTELVAYATGPDSATRTAARVLLRDLADGGGIAGEDLAVARVVLATP